MDNKLAEQLVKKAMLQLSEGLEAKKERMDTVKTIIDLYNNKKLDLGEDSVMNIPFPIMSKQIDSYYSKIDEPPTLIFKLPNRKNLSDKIQQAWLQESSSTRSGWRRKDRAEKKKALLSGRGIAKIYSSSIDNKYKSHYEVVDFFNFVADPTRGDLEAGKYHGEVNLLKTKAFLKGMAQKGIYNSSQVEKIINSSNGGTGEERQAAENQKERLKTLNINLNITTASDQYNFVQWVMKHDEKWYYLLFDLETGYWVRADDLKNVTASGKTMYTSWAVNYDEFAFWTKGVGDDILPTAEAIRYSLNSALENDRRRNRPMRIVSANSFADVNELMDYIPDNVIVSQSGQKPEMITVETPQITTTLNLVEFLNGFIESKSGVGGQGADKPDTKVGVYYGQLAQEADIIGTINKEYSESYAHKGYRFFWGLKRDLTGTIALEMLGKGGVKLMELSSVEMKNVDDVDDIEVSGGAREEEINAVQNERQAKTISELAKAYPDRLNPDWVIKTNLKREGFTDEDIVQALDKEGSYNQELMNEADEAIQQILLGNTPKLNNGANLAFLERIRDFAVNNLDYVKLDKAGNEIGIDRKKQQQFNDLLAYMRAHQKIVIENGQSNVRQMQLAQTQQSVTGLNMPETNQRDQQLALARPGESTLAQGTPQGTASLSQNTTQTVSP